MRSGRRSNDRTASARRTPAWLKARILVSRTETSATSAAEKKTVDAEQEYENDQTDRERQVFHRLSRGSGETSRPDPRLGSAGENRLIDRTHPSTGHETLMIDQWFDRSRTKMSLKRMRPSPPECSCSAMTPSVEPGEGYVKSIISTPLR